VKVQAKKQRRIGRSTALFALVCLVALLGGCTWAQTDSNTTGAEIQQTLDEHEIEALMRMYVRAVNDADYELLREIWVPTDEISYVNPLQRLESRDELEAFWQSFIVESFAERELTLSNVSIHVAGSTTESASAAWAVFDWNFSATTADGQPFNTTGWESQFYRLTNDGWRIAHVHYSIPPPPQEPD